MDTSDEVDRKIETTVGCSGCVLYVALGLLVVLWAWYWLG